MTINVTDRIQKRILSETREKLAETERQLGVCEGQIKRLTEVISTKQSVMNQKIKEAEEQLAMVAEKDQKILMLQNRLASLNDEYNGIRLGRTHEYNDTNQGKSQISIMIEEHLERIERGKRGALTVEDIKKMTNDYRS